MNKFKKGDEVFYDFSSGERWFGIVREVPNKKDEWYEVYYTDQDVLDFDYEQNIKKATKLDKVLK